MWAKHRELRAVGLGTRASDFSPPEESRKDHAQLGDADRQTLIDSHSQAPDSRPVKSDHVDHSALGPAFKLTEVSLNTHPLAIPNALRQMAH